MKSRSGLQEEKWICRNFFFEGAGQRPKADAKGEGEGVLLP